MNRWVQILLVFFMLTLASVVNAQAPVTCGIAGADGPSEVDPGASLVFKVRLTNTSQPEFKWTVSAGTIVKGQGTDEITVDTVGLAGQAVTATVELIGAPSGCKSSVSTTAQVKPPPACGLAFDAYGDISFEDEKARLDNFGIQLANIPESSGLIHMSVGQKTFKMEAAYRLDRARSYLVRVRGIDSNRLVTVDCGFTQELRAMLWVVPPGATLPECDIAHQIPLLEVKFTKPRPKAAKKRR